MSADQQLYADDLHEGFSFAGHEKILTAEMFSLFGKLTGDNHPIHYDEAYAAQTKFGKPVAHGLLLSALTAVGSTELSMRLEAAMVAFVSQSAEFLKPAFVGDRLTVSYEVLANNCGDGRKTARVEIGVSMSNTSGDIVMKGRHAYLLRCRPT